MIPLLPYEKYIIGQIGCTEEEYLWFKSQVIRRSILQPAEGPRAGFIVPILVNLVIGIGLSLLSALLFPQPRQRERPEITATREGGKGLRSNTSASPRSGFNSLQEVASIGQIVPVVIAKRQQAVGGQQFLGGVRVNLPLVWSRMRSLKGSQFFMGIFLAGAAPMSQNAWDQRGWAFGNNTLGAYAFTGVAEFEGGRFTFYYRNNGGRVLPADYILGRNPETEPGNAVNDPEPGPDVFAFRGAGDSWVRQFAMAETPSTSKVFGLFGWCPNAMLYRATTAIRPTMQAQIDANNYVVARDDASALCDIWEAKYHWSMRGAVVELRLNGSPDWSTVVPGGSFAVENRSVMPGDRVRYYLGNSTDSATTIKFDTSNSAFLVDNDSSADLKTTQVGAGVAGRQVSADNILSVGELYRIGSAWAVLEERQPSFNPVRDFFVSDQDEEPPGNGTSMFYQFVIVRAGVITFASPDCLNPPEAGQTIFPPPWDRDTELSTVANNTYFRYGTCSRYSQIFRMAVASVSSVREVRLMEIGLKSRVGISINGMTEFRSCPTVKQINDRAGYTKHLTFADGTISTAIYTSNTLTTRAQRYSLFAMSYRNLSSVNWTLYPEIFAVAGNSQEDVYSFIRVEFPNLARWEVRLEPISSWELRSGQVNSIRVVDSRGDRERFSAGGSVFVTTIGYRVNPLNPKIRKIQQLEPAVDIGIGWSDTDGFDNSMTDLWASFAEGFCYDQIQTSVNSQPEHEIVYVNYQSVDETIPSYDSLAIVGVNISATQEIDNLPQLSGYCINGYEMRRLLNSDTIASTNLFPDWLRELMTNPELGLEPPVPDAQIDRPSFQAAAQWCQDRDYFYDAVEAEPFNLFRWAEDVAAAHLLKLLKVSGKFYLRPVFSFTAPLPISALFTNGNIVEGSFSLETNDQAARQPVQVQVKWREERALSGATNEALFARERSAVVREASTSETAPFEQLDLSAWCTNYRQAIDAACFVIRFRRLSDHRIKFQTTPDMLAVSLSCGDCIRVALDVLQYDQAVQGYINADGVPVTTRPDLLPAVPGNYDAILWDGGNDDVIDGQVTRTVEGTYEPASHFFAIKQGASEVRTYEISDLSIDGNGVISVEAFHHPVAEDGISLLAKSWTSYGDDLNWRIAL